tara:strand:- start:311 stop:616 length:306 start_codon:yes stop_codon:yes gene_type:complete
MSWQTLEIDEGTIMVALGSEQVDTTESQRSQDSAGLGVWSRDDEDDEAEDIEEEEEEEEEEEDGFDGDEEEDGDDSFDDFDDLDEDDEEEEFFDDEFAGLG